MTIEVTILGSGDAFGTPKPGCKVNACVAKTQFNKRSRFSVLIRANGRTILVGTAPEISQQFLREGLALSEVDNILLTHIHYDQTGGLGEFDGIGNRPPVKLFCDQGVLAEINTYFKFLFEKNRLNVNLLEANQKLVSDDFVVTPFQVNHFKCPCLGFRLEIDGKVIVIAADTNADLSPSSLELMKDADLLVLDGMAESNREILLTKRDLSGRSEAEFNATVNPNKRGHMLIPEAVELSKKLSPKKTILSHISHYNASHEEMQAKYETKNLLISFDGMKIKL
ncbi:MAG: MBL fold metallo-hydrolase [Candidatus Micrarchaeota archaeon]